MTLASKPFALTRAASRSVLALTRAASWSVLALMLAIAVLPAPAGAEEGPVAAVNTEHGLAIHGYDPVAYFLDGEAREGSPEHTARHAGATYRFVSAEHRDRFVAEPERWLPQYGGWCAYAMSVDSIADIDPRRWSITDGKLYLNAGYLASGLWAVGTASNIEKADAHWAGLEKEPPAP